MHDKLNFPIVISKGDVMFRQNSGNGCSSTRFRFIRYVNYLFVLVYISSAWTKSPRFLKKCNFKHEIKKSWLTLLLQLN